MFMSLVPSSDAADYYVPYNTKRRPRRGPPKKSVHQPNVVYYKTEANNKAHDLEDSRPVKRKKNQIFNPIIVSKLLSETIRNGPLSSMAGGLNYGPHLDDFQRWISVDTLLRLKSLTSMVLRWTSTPFKCNEGQSCYTLPSILSREVLSFRGGVQSFPVTKLSILRFMENSASQVLGLVSELHQDDVVGSSSEVGISDTPPVMFRICVVVKSAIPAEYLFSVVDSLSTTLKHNLKIVLLPKQMDDEIHTTCMKGLTLCHLTRNMLIVNNITS